MVFMAALRESHHVYGKDVWLTSFRANLLIVVIVAGLSIYFTHQNKLAEAGKKVIHGRVTFRYTL